MNAKSLAILVAVTAAFVLAAMFAVGGKDGAEASDADGSGPLLAGLSAGVNDVTRITLTKAGETVTLVRAGETWTCLEAAGYPARFDRIKEVLLELAQMTIVEAMTASPEKYAQLGVDDDGARVVLATDDGATVCDVVIGVTRYSRNGSRVFARRGGEERAWLCEADLNLTAVPTEWIDKEICRLDNARPSRVTITHADGENVRVSREGPTAPAWTVEDVPADRVAKDGNAADPVGTALSYLSFDEVRPAGELDLEGQHAGTARYETFDGLVVELRLARIDGQNWLTLDADARTAVDALGPPAPEEGPVEASDGARDAEVAAEAEALDARHGGWAYRVPQFKADLLLRRMEELLQPLPTPEPTPEPAEAEAPVGEDG